MRVFHLRFQGGDLCFHRPVLGEFGELLLEVFRDEGFGDVVVGTAAHGLHRRFDGRLRGEDDGRNQVSLGLQLGEEVQTVFLTEVHIEQHRIDLLLLELAGSVSHVFRSLHRVPHRSQAIGGGPQDAGLIINNEDIHVTLQNAEFVPDGRACGDEIVC